MRIITASHLTAWASQHKRDCQETLPLLIRRLIRSTTDKIDAIDFPGGDAISDEGWDGQLTCSPRTSFVPNGASGWEIGTDRSAASKAEDDYNKRTKDALGLQQAATAFVFVTPRTWPKRNAWLKAKQASSPWREIRVVAAGELEQWLEEAPVVALWLAKHLGLAPTTGFYDAQTWWDMWSMGTRPYMTAEMLIAGREHDVLSAREWLDRPSGRFEMQADVPDEAIAFLISAVSSSEDEKYQDLLYRSVVVTTAEAFQAASSWSFPLLIISRADEAQFSAGQALVNGHKLFLAVGRDFGSRNNNIRKLPRVDGFALRKALHATGMSFEEAAGLVIECGRSLAVLYRRRSAVEAVRRPAWATHGVGHKLVPALLAGAWSDVLRPTDPGILGVVPTPLLDRSVLTHLAASESYDEAIDEFRHLFAIDDPPLLRAPDIWKVTSPIDAWYLLGEYVDKGALDRFAIDATHIISSRNPKYELEDDKQWMASFYGKEAPYSDWLTKGIVITLATIAHHGDNLDLPIPGGSSADYVGEITQAALSQFTRWQDWASADSILPLIAEASPQVFLDNVSRFLADHPGEARQLLSDGGSDRLGGECRHAGMLWALERIAWSSEYLSHSLLVLSELNEIDPGGRWANRPFSTLAEIFIEPGHPDTYADVTTCLAAFDGLMERFSSIGWRLLMKACSLPGVRLVRDPPAYLPARPDGWQPWNSNAHQAFWTGMRQRLCDALDQASCSLAIDALTHVQRLPEDAIRRLLSRVNILGQKGSPEDRVAICDALRIILHNARSYFKSDTSRSNLESEISSVFEALSSADELTNITWLFQNGIPPLAQGEVSDWQENLRRAEKRRQEAIETLLQKHEIRDILTSGAEFPNKMAFGTAIAAATSPLIDMSTLSLLLDQVDAAEEIIPALLLSYVITKFNAFGMSWVDKASQIVQDRPNEQACLAAIYAALPSTPEVWRVIDSLSPEVSRLYWKWNWWGGDKDISDSDTNYALNALLAVGRSSVALNIISMSPKRQYLGVTLSRLAHELFADIQSGKLHNAGNLHWNVGQLFECMDLNAQARPEDVALLEWRFLPLLEHAERGPQVLCNDLAKDPAFFSQMVGLSRMDLVQSEELEDELTPERRSDISQLARKLLHLWKVPFPGMEDGQLVAKTLLNWVSEARRACEQAGHVQAGDLRLGELLANSPIDPDDGAWPHAAVRSVLEIHLNDTIDSAFRTAVHNNRGATVRAVGAGGDLEREESSKFDQWAKIARPKAPKTGRMLELLPFKLGHMHRSRQRRCSCDTRRL